MKKLFLTLADGRVWNGRGTPAGEATEGEVVFTTASCGYPQSITDPSYNGQILVFAFPPTGIYGVDMERLQGERPWVRGVVIHLLEETPLPKVEQLSDWLSSWNVPLMTGVDCRDLILHLREHGTIMGRMAETVGAPEISSLPSTLVDQVSTKEVVKYGDGNSTIALVDYGVKLNIIRELLGRGCRVVRFPHDASASDILACNPDGVLLSNGPGDPGVLHGETSVIAELLGHVPLFGICLGTQLLALACGAETAKLPYGHRGINQPVLDLRSGRGYVTSQNHGYAIVEESLAGTGLEISFRHLGDGTVEGIFDSRRSISGVQFHPEAGAGPLDGTFLFDEFLEMIKGVSSDE